MRMYCFLRFLRKWVRVCESVFSTIVACTSTKPGARRGRPIREKSLPPASSTLSSRNRSPFSGGQYPSTTMISPVVILNCLPHSCTTANNRPSVPVSSCLLIASAVLLSASGTTALELFHRWWPLRANAGLLFHREAGTAARAGRRFGSFSGRAIVCATHASVIEHVGRRVRLECSVPPPYRSR
uniref:Putative secreted protein n=1 Tax=Anopheles darlingi TaxID=43151 RepID=A0A2M4DH76_ANODA